MKMKMNKKLILVIALILIVGGIYYLEKTKLKIPEGINRNNLQQENLGEISKEGYIKAPELTGISGYINAEEGLKISDLTSQGKVVLIDFWTYTCINCIRTLPYLTSWDEKYKEMGLVIIGVHTPEFTYEKEYENVKDATIKYNIKYPVVQDNDYATWGAYKNRYWPRKYLIDTQGFIRYDHIGEGAYEITEAKIQELLSEIGKNVGNIELTQEKAEESYPARTPELYAGHSFALSRGQDLGNAQGIQPGKTIEYTLPNEITNDKIYLEGKWKSNPDDLQLISETGSIVLKFTGKSVNIVADPLGKNIEIEIFINGEYITKAFGGSDIQFEGTKAYIMVNKPQLYNVFEGDYGNYELNIKVKSSDFTFNAFTFG